MCMDHINIGIIKHRRKQILKEGGNRYQHKFNYFHPTFQKIAWIPPGMCRLPFEEGVSHCSLAEPSFSSEPRKEGFFLSWLNFPGGLPVHCYVTHIHLAQGREDAFYFCTLSDTRRRIK